MPYTFGHTFKKGEVSAGSKVKLGSITTQCDIQNAWEDGSVKIAVLSALLPLVANAATPFQLSVGASASGTALTEANLATALVGKGLVVQVGALGTASLAPLVGTAAKLMTRISGPLMSEFHYQVSIDAVTAVKFMARVYSTGAVWVRYVVHNGYMTGTGANRTYDLTVTSNGVATTTAGIDQKTNTRITGKAWLSSDPAITPKHNGAYISESKLVPNYATQHAPSEATLALWTATYAPMGRVNLRADFFATGYDDQIGLLPRWDALHIKSGDPRTYAAVIANAEAGGSYSIHYMDATTKRPWAFSTAPNWWQQETTSTGGQAWAVDIAHQPSIGYLAYLLTGDYYFVEEVQYWATFNAGYIPAVARKGADCRIYGPARAVAWSFRTLAHAAVITPDGDNLQVEFSNSWRANMLFRVAQYVTGTEDDQRNNLGVLSVYSGGSDGDAYSPGDYKWVDAPWMQHFLESALGYTWNIEIPSQTTTDKNNHRAVRDIAYKHVVGMLGDASGRPYPYAGAYGVEYGVTATANELYSPIQYYPSWAVQWVAQKIRSNITIEVPSTLGSPLIGESGGNPSGFATGYWGNLHSAIAYAVEHNAQGADAAYQRLTSASNYIAGTEDFSDTPQFGIYPDTSEVIEPTMPIVIRTVSVASGKVIYGGRSAIVIPDPSMPAWRQGMVAWEVRAFAGTANMPDTETPFPSEIHIVSGPASRINAWSSLASKAGIVYGPANGGHMDYAGNEMMAIDLMQSVPKWMLKTLPSRGSALAYNNPYNLDGLPTSSHVYYGAQAVGNQIIKVGCDYPYGDGTTTSGRPIATYDIASNAWLPMGTWPDTPGASGIYATVKDPRTEEIYVPTYDGQKLQKRSPTTGLYSILANLPETDRGHFYYVSGAVDTKRNRIVYFGNSKNNGTGYAFDIATNAFSSITFTGADVSIAIGNQGYMGYYIPTLDKFILTSGKFASASGACIWLIDPVTFELTRLALGGQVGSVKDSLNGVFSRFLYVSELNGFFIHWDYSDNAYFIALPTN